MPALIPQHSSPPSPHAPLRLLALPCAPAALRVTPPARLRAAECSAVCRTELFECLAEMPEKSPTASTGWSFRSSSKRTARQYLATIPLLTHFGRLVHCIVGAMNLSIFEVSIIFSFVCPLSCALFLLPLNPFLSPSACALPRLCFQFAPLSCPCLLRNIRTRQYCLFIFLSELLTIYCPDMHTCGHMDTHAHTNAHTHANIHADTRPHAHTHGRTHARTHAGHARTARQPVRMHVRKAAHAR